MRRILKYGPYSRVKFSHGQGVLADLRAVHCKFQLLIWVLLPVLARAATPSFEARECAPAAFPNGRVAVAPQGGHVFDGLTGVESCLDATIIRLFDMGDARGLDTSCFADMKAPPFEAVP